MARSTAWVLPALTAASVLLAACGATSAGPATATKSAIPLAAAHFAPYRATYKISGPVTGTMTVQVAHAADGTMQLSQDQSVGKVTEHEAFVLGANDFTVRQATERIEVRGENVTISAEPKGQQMQVNATVNGRAEAPTIPLHSPWQVNGVLLTALSGVQLRPDETATIEDVILQHATSVPLALSVGNATTLATAMGNLRCYPVSLSAGGKVQTAWYEAAAPHALLKYVNGKETFQIATLTK